MGESMKFIFLTKDYFNRHPSSEFPEMLRKSDRPYVQLTIPCNHQLWAIPLRSYINHEFAFLSNKKELCGLDFTKAVPIELKDIDTTHSPIIRRHEFNALKGKDYRVTQRFKHFIKKFDYAKLHPTLPDSKVLLKYSTLQYFEKELEQKKKIKLTIPKQNSTLSL